MKLTDTAYVAIFAKICVYALFTSHVYTNHMNYSLPQIWVFIGLAAFCVIELLFTFMAVYDYNKGNFKR